MPIRNVYIASPFENRNEASEFALNLMSRRVTIVSRWHDMAPSHIHNVVDVINNEHLYKHNYNELHNWAKQDLEDIDNSDWFILLKTEALIQRMGSYVEFGYALARSKRIVVIGKLDNVFQILTWVKSYPDLEAFYMAVDNGSI